MDQSFTPLVFSTTGGMGRLASIYSRLAKMLSEKRQPPFSTTIDGMAMEYRFVPIVSDVNISHIQISVHAFSEKKQAAWLYCHAVNMVLASYSGLGNLANLPKSICIPTIFCYLATAYVDIPYVYIVLIWSWLL